MAVGRGHGDTVDVEVDVQSNPQDARDAALQITSAMRRVFDKAFREIADDITDILTKGFKGGGFTDLREGMREVTATGRVMHGQFDTLESDLAELAARSRAFKESLDRRNINPKIFAVYEVELGKLLKLQEEFRIRSAQGALSPEFIESINQQRLLVGKALDKEAQNIRDVAQLERSAMVVETQRAGAQRLAETRIAGQRLIQQERQTSRARIELFRAAQRQILFLEQQLAAGFRAAFRLVQTTISGVGSALGSLGRLFRRGNNDLNDGLRGALIQREGSISRSFRRQTTDVRTELSRQERLIQRFQTEASTGIVGAVSGRSQLGAALGLGAGIGGGFALFQGLRNGIRIGGDFVQGLAVLQAQLGLTDKQMQAVRAQSIELGNDISLPGVSALDAAQAIQVLSKQFANLGAAALPAAQGAARGVLQLARAAGVAAEDAARVVGAAVNVFGLNANQAVIAADQVTNALTKAAGVGFNDFSDSFTQAAGVVNLFTGSASNAGEAMAEFNAAIAILAKNGLIGSDAGTSLKQFFLQANRGTEDAKEKLEAISAAAGVSGSVFFDAAGNARRFADSLDILRRGTRDLNDQQLSATLGKLFGSDAARAAAFLIRSTKEEFDNLVSSIRKSGAAADIAAAQNTGLRGALDALRSVIETQQIKTYEKYQGVLAEVVLKFSELLNAFFEGRGKMGVLRAAIVGLATALGGLLVVKAVAEGFQFLGLSLTALASPLGIVVTGLGALGAAVAVLRKVSPDFRKETDRIAEVIRGGFGDAAGTLGDLLASISHLLRTEVIPRFIEFGEAAAHRVLPVVHEVIDVVSELSGAFRTGLSGEKTATGGLVGFAERLGRAARQVAIGAQAFQAAFSGRNFTTVLNSSGLLSDERQTAFVRFAERLGQAAGGLRAALSGEEVKSSGGLVKFASNVGSALRQASLGVQAFTAAIQGQDFTKVLSDTGLLSEERQTAFVRFFEGLGSTLRSVAQDIAGIGDAIGLAASTGDFTPLRDRLLEAFRDFSDRAVDILGPALSRIIGFISDQFSPRNLERVINSVAGIVFQIGETFGTIVSDPRFVAALEGIVLALSATAAIAIAGFAKGVADNLPELGKLLVKQFQFVFNEIFKDGIDYKKIGGFIVLGLTAALLLSSTITGFKRAFKAPAEKAGKEAALGFASSFGSNIRQGLRRNDFASVLLPGSGGFTGFAERQIQRDADRLFAAQQKAAERIRLLSGTTNIAQAFAGVDPAIDAAGADAVRRLQAFEDHFGKGAVAAGILRGRLKEVFIQAGEVGSAIKSAFSGTEPFLGIPQDQQVRRSIGGLFTQLGKFAGEAFAQARQLFVGGGQALGGAILSGIGSVLAGQAVGQGGGKLQVGLGIAGIISSALFASAAVGGGVQGAIVGTIVAGIGTISAITAAHGRASKKAAAEVREYADALREVKDASEIVPTAAEVVRTNLQEQSTQVRTFLRDVGFDAQDFAQKVVDGTFDLDDALATVAPGLGRNSSAIIRELKRIAKEGGDPIEALNKAIEGNLPAGTGQGLLDLRNAIASLPVERARTLVDTLKALLAEGGELTLGLDVSGVDRDLDNLVGSVERETKRAQKALQDTALSADNLARLRVIRFELPDIAAQQRGFDHLKEVAGAVDQAIEQLNQQRTERLNNQIAEVTSQLQAARDAAAQALTNITELFGGDLGDPLVNAFDQFLSALPAQQEALAKALSELPAGVDVATALTPEAKNVRDALNPILGPLQQLVSNAITTGAADADLSGSVSAEELQAFIEQNVTPIIRNFKVDQTVEVDGETVIQKVSLPKNVQDFLIAQLNSALDSPALVAELQQFEISNKAASDLQDDLDELNAKLLVDVEFDPRSILATLVTLKDLGLFTGDLPTLGEIVATQQAAKLAAEQAAIDARLPANTSALPPLAGGGITIQELNINAADEPIATGGEVIRAFRTLAGGGITGVESAQRLLVGLPA